MRERSSPYNIVVEMTQDEWALVIFQLAEYADNAAKAMPQVTDETESGKEIREMILQQMNTAKALRERMLSENGWMP